MASFYQEDGKGKVAFINPTTEQRAKISLGKISIRQGNVFAAKVQALADYRKINMPIDAKLALWVEGLPERYINRLYELGLIDRRLIRISLGEFLDSYKSRRSKQVEESTLKVWGHTIRNLKEFFGPENLFIPLRKKRPKIGETGLRSKKNLRSRQSESGSALQSSSLKRQSEKITSVAILLLI